MDRTLLNCIILSTILLLAPPALGDGEQPEPPVEVEEAPLVDLTTARANTKGNELVWEGKFEEAVEAYHEEALKRPENGILQRNLAGALARAGRGDESLAAYSQALRFADGNKERAKVLYDLGNALVMAEQAEQAMELWAQAMILDPEDMDLKHNFEFLLKQQQEGEGKDQGDGENDQEREPEDSDQSEQEQQEGEQEEEPQQQQGQEEQESEQPEPQEQQPEPSAEDEMSEEDAQRLLDAMLEEEKELQAERLKKQKTDKKNVEKDW
ncbi:MAG: hypothetical protein GY835_04225 [bacterium]|nr:hypothetical protein [bacterium]